MALNSNCFAFILLTCLLSNSLIFNVVGEETEFSYDLGAPDGPRNWSNINPNWTKCGTGRSQSPINIVEDSVVETPSLQTLTRTYMPAPAIIKNKGREIEVKWTGDAGGIIINGNEFKLLRCHWHIPSEHTLDGVRYSMELHAVHNNSQNDIAVLAILYRLGLPDPFLQRLSPFISSADGNGTQLGIVNPNDIGFGLGFLFQKYYRYNGSLTTPPCSENVSWTVFKTVKTVSTAQIQQLRDAVNDGGTGNARPLQPLNGRTISKPRCLLIFCF